MTITANDTTDLIDVSRTAREANIKHPTLMTRAAWEDCVEWQLEDDKRKNGRVAQDQPGRLWDVLWMACWQVGHIADRAAKISNHGGHSVPFALYRVPRHGTGVMPREVTLRARFLSNDDDGVTILISLPDEN